ncbi:MAG: cbb3-type cytochrome oxidase assembly protein CcoS [Pseudomonadota bacterium]
MEIIYLLIPLSIVLIAVIAWVFTWAIRSGQFDDLEGPAHRIIMDDDSPRPESDTDPAHAHDKETTASQDQK